MAVCAYHKCDHLWTIPQLLKAANPDYKIYLRRYAEDCWETVYYAVPPERLCGNAHTDGAVSEEVGMPVVATSSGIIVPPRFSNRGAICRRLFSSLSTRWTAGPPPRISGPLEIVQTRRHPFPLHRHRRSEAARNRFRIRYHLAVWINHFHVDAYGAEPGGEGFNQGFIASRKLLAANGIDPERVVDSAGESLPFPDASFDIVYSANVLEHTDNPERVLSEALRVLRPGGLLHMEMPNFLSYFEGHYMVVQPPIFWKPLLAWWVKLVFRRDPAFARTLQTKVNPFGAGAP